MSTKNHTKSRYLRLSTDIEYSSGSQNPVLDFPEVVFFQQRPPEQKMPFVTYDPFREIFREPFSADEPDLLPGGISQPITPDFPVQAASIFCYKTGEVKQSPSSDASDIYRHVYLRPLPKNVNLISAEDWSGIEGNETLQGLIEVGAIKVVMESHVDNQKSFSLTDFVPKVLSDKPERLKAQLKQVNAIVAATSDLRQLNEWAQTIPQGLHGAIWSAVSTRIAEVVNPGSRRVSRRTR